MAADRMGGTLQRGDVLNNTYEIDELIAIGGTGEVYRARNRAAGREIAIKILRREYAGNETFLDLMRREAAVLHEVRDDAVVRYYDILHSDLHGGFTFLVMEYIRGESLADRMARAPLDEPTCLVIARRVAQGLKASHDKKAYHRDLSPDNVILREGDPARAVLIDFGIAKDVNEDARTIIGGGFAGKYQYAAPEQINGHSDGRSDLYSLGMTLIGAFRGGPPSAGASNIDILRAKDDPPEISDLPGKLRQLVGKLTNPDPNQRFQTPDEVLGFLSGSAMPPPAAEPAPSAARVTPPPSVSAPRRSSGGLVTVLLLLVALLGGGGWYFGLGPGRDLIAPQAPEVESYRMEILMAGPGRMRVSGHAPSDDAVATALTALTSLNNGTLPEGAIEAARNVPHPEWPNAVLAMARAASRMQVWWIYVEGLEAEIAGEVQDAAVRSAVIEAARTAAAEAGITLTDSIEIVRAPLERQALTRDVSGFATCGPLAVTGGQGEHFLANDGITVTGYIARAEEEALLRDAITPLLDGRALTLSLEVVNPPVCRVLSLLPARTLPGTAFRFAYGAKDGVVEEDSYFVGENPVIDLVLPPESSGYLHVFYADSVGKVNQFLPRNNREENAIDRIGTVDETGQRIVQLSWPLAEHASQTLAFEVPAENPDENLFLGKNIMVALVSQTPLFDELQPFEEGLSVFVRDLEPALQRAKPAVVWRFLITKEKP